MASHPQPPENLTTPEPTWGWWGRVGWLLIDRLTAPQFILSLVSTGLFAWLLNRLLEGAIPDNARELVSAALGFLIGQMVGPGYQFYLGNTKSADDKTVALKANAETMRAAGLPVGGERKPDVHIDAEHADVNTPGPRPGDSQ